MGATLRCTNCEGTEFTCAGCGILADRVLATASAGDRPTGLREALEGAVNLAESLARVTRPERRGVPSVSVGVLRSLLAAHPVERSAAIRKGDGTLLGWRSAPEVAGALEDGDLAIVSVPGLIDATLAQCVMFEDPPALGWELVGHSRPFEMDEVQIWQRLSVTSVAEVRS